MDNRKAMETGDPRLMVGCGFAVKRIDDTNVVKGVCGGVTVHAGERYYTLYANAEYARRNMQDTGNIGEYKLGDLYPTRQAALQSRRLLGEASKYRQRDKGLLYPGPGVNLKDPVIKQLIDMPCPITSLLEEDLYKFSMCQFALHRYPRTVVRVTFINRGPEKLGFLKPVIDKWLDQLCKLRFSDCALRWIADELKWLSSDFVGFLRRFYLFREQVHTEVDRHGELVMWAEGPWVDVIWFECKCLALVCEAHARYRLMKLPKQEQEDILRERDVRAMDRIAKLGKLNETYPFSFSEFGFRRASSREWEDKIVYMMAQAGKGKWFTGTSNMKLAYQYGLKPSGTMAHELFMGMQNVGIQLPYVQREVWRQWMDEFQGRNGILLTDPFGLMQCLRDLDWHVANSFQGFRFDSGDTVVGAELMIRKLEKLGIDPATKTFVWSDTLDYGAIEKLAIRFSRRIKICGMGVGTWECHDLGPKIPPTNAVMKLSMSNGKPVFKIPDSAGKRVHAVADIVEAAKKELDYKEMPKEL